MSNRKVFVGGLSWDTDNNSLNDFFTQCGEVVEAKVITDRETGRSRGFGFVSFTEVDSATRAIDMNGEELDGRAIRVDYANDQGRGGGGGRDRDRDRQRY